MTTKKTDFIRINTHNKLIFNLLLWVCSYLILIFLFSGRKTPEKIDYIYTGCFLVTLIIPVSINLYYLIPKYLKQEKHGLFSIFFIFNLLVFSALNPLFFDFVVSTFFSDYFFISYHNSIEILFLFFIFFVLTSLIKLGEDWLYLNKLERKILETEKEQIAQQLYYLKGQINPHFLFNSLNVLYSLAISKKEGIDKAILQLSDILRYVIYDVESDKVPLEKEIELIHSFISFEKNRQIKNANISFEHSKSGCFAIYPMLLLPLVENSFKHGMKSGIENPFVRISLHEKNGILKFDISNNFKPKTQAQNNGIGLENIQKNLGLIYSERHEFATEIKKDVFSVSLSLDLKS